MLVAVLSGFGLAMLAPVIVRATPRFAGLIIAVLPLALTGYFATLAPRVADGEVVTERYTWAAALDVHLTFRLDGLSLVFAFMVTGIGALVMFYTGGYLKGHRDLGRLYVLLLAFMASMLGLVLSDNLIALFVFWELTTITSYLLIGFDHERTAARAAALQSLLVTAIGGQALLWGLVLLGFVGGDFEISNLFGEAAAIQEHHLYIPLMLLILLGAFTKSAQVPFHFWLPGAMEAPTPVSAYLHSATMVKAGVYLLARFNPILGGTTWQIILVSFGTITMLVTIFLSLRQTDLKRILAYTTVSALGILVLAIGIGTTGAITAAVVYLIGHALYKGALFLVAGAVDHETGTRDVTQLGGLARLMPITAAAAGVAALSLAGVPPLLGFIGKELVLANAIYEDPSVWLSGAVVLGAAMTVGAAGLIAVKPFFGPLGQTPKHPHEGPVSLWLGPAVLASLSLAFGVLPFLITDWLIAPAVNAIIGVPVDVEVVLWPGVNLALVLSGVAITLGAVIYVLRDPIRDASMALDGLRQVTPSRGYELAVAGLNRAALAQTRFLQNGYLRAYVATIALTTVALTGYTLITRDGLDAVSFAGLSDIRIYEGIVAGVVVAATLIAVFTDSRLAAVAALGAVGYGIAMIYVLFSAPDLAMTQILVDILTVVLFVLVLYRLPRFAKLSNTRARLRDAVIAISVGVLMTSLLLAATTASPTPIISNYYAEQAYPAAEGRNIVNVILVDFRAMDTLGEIIVLAVAALGVFALLRLAPGTTITEKED